MGEVLKAVKADKPKRPYVKKKVVKIVKEKDLPVVGEGEVNTPQPKQQESQLSEIEKAKLILQNEAKERVIAFWGEFNVLCNKYKCTVQVTNRFVDNNTIQNIVVPVALTDEEFDKTN